MLSSLINLSDLRYKGNTISEISAYTSIVVIIATTGSMLAIIIRLIKFSRNMNENSVKEFSQKFSPLLSDLKETSLNRVVTLWKALNLIRLLLTLIVLTTINSYPTLQIQFLLIFSFFFQCLLLTFQPYATKMLNILSFLNELSVSIYLYLALLLSDYLEFQFI
jgi:hypothetical protein